MELLMAALENERFSYDGEHYKVEDSDRAAARP